MNSLSRSRTPRAKDSSRLKTSFLGNPEQKDEAIASLNQTQKIFEKSGKFMEAQNTKKKGLVLREQYYKKQLDALKKDHAQQSQQIYLIHELEMKKFQIGRAKRMREQADDVREREQEMRKKHEADLVAYAQQLEKECTLKLRQSPQLMNYKKVLDKLAKQEKYFEAHQLQHKITHLEKQQNPKFIYERNKRIENLLFQRKEKHKAEMKALKQKLKSGFDENKKVLDAEENQLKQKYYNIMADLELCQKSELRKLEKERKVHKDKYSVTRAFTYLGN